MYGKYVNDDMTLDYDRIFTTAVGALQEQQKQIDQLKAENDALKQKIEEIENKINL